MRLVVSTLVLPCVQEAVVQAYCESARTLLAAHLLSPLTALVTQYLYPTPPTTTLEQRCISHLTARVAELFKYGKERSASDS